LAHVGVHAYSVLARHIEIGGGWQLLQGGFALDAAATFWLGRRLGLGFVLFYRFGDSVDSPADIEGGWTAGGALSAKWWLSPRWALGLAVSPRYGRIDEQTDPDPNRIAVDITVGLTVRP
jgi:hypothetical protein